MEKTLRIFFALFIFIVSGWGGDLHADTTEMMQQAQFEYSHRNFDKAVRLYTKAASLNNPRAMFMLGGMYERGEGVKKNLIEAVVWYKKSASLGSVSALKQLANM